MIIKIVSVCSELLNDFLGLHGLHGFARKNLQTETSAISWVCTAFQFSEPNFPLESRVSGLHLLRRGMRVQTAPRTSPIYGFFKLGDI